MKFGNTMISLVTMTFLISEFWLNKIIGYVSEAACAAVTILIYRRTK
jgi:hypothetical protein